MNKIAHMVERIDDPDGPFMTVGEVADYLERSTDTIRRWCKKLRDGGTKIPNHVMHLNEKGTSFVWLYTKDDLEILEKFCENINPKGGRPPKRKEENA